MTRVGSQRHRKRGREKERPMLEFHVRNQSYVLKCRYMALGTYVGRKLTATRAITFGEDNHSFALTKGRCHINNNVTDGIRQQIQ
jgi:hypothetical protein